MQVTEVRHQVEPDDSVLVIGCADGLQRNPQQTKKKIIHRIHRPGGALWSKFLSQNPTKNRVVNVVLRTLQLHHFHKWILDHSLMSEAKLMVELKSPKVIFVTGHDPCKAAEALGMNKEDVTKELSAFAEKLAYKLGVDGPPIELLFQSHCRHGSWHNYHESYGVFSAASGFAEMA